jgi:hypothetical protein
MKQILKFILEIISIFGIIAGLGFAIAGVVIAFADKSSAPGHIVVGSMWAAPSLVTYKYLNSWNPTKR